MANLTQAVSQGSWAGNFCVRTQIDKKTGIKEIEGRCLMGLSSEEPIACWRPDTGWSGDHFAQTPVKRIKGWLEIAEYLLKEVPKKEACDRILVLRSAVDAFAMVDKITTDSNVKWGPSFLRLYNAMRDFTVTVSDDLLVPADGGSVDPTNPANDTTPNGVAKKLDVAPRRQQMINLGLAVGLMHNAIDQNKDTIEDVTAIAQVEGGIVAAVQDGLAAYGTFLIGDWFATIGYAVAAVVAVISVIQGIGKLIRHWFHF